jgi:hypothetical protein
VFKKYLLDDFRKTHLKKEPAFRRVAQQWQARPQHNLGGGFVTTPAALAEAPDDSLHTPFGFWLLHRERIE